MNYEIGFVVTAILLVAFVIYYIFQKKAYDKILFDYKPLKLKYENLRMDYDKLRQSLPKDSNDGTASGKKGKKASKKKDTAPVAAVQELRDRIHSLEEDNSRLKKKNYDLALDNKKLRGENKTRANGDKSGQREILALRDEKASIQLALEQAENRCKSLEAQYREATQSRTEAPSDTSEALAAAEREKEALAASLKDVRAELANMKREFRNEVDEAKREAQNKSADAGRDARKELDGMRRALEQARKRADNDHKVYLIARSQLRLVEQKLMALDESYRPLPGMPVKDDAIDEYVKKFMTTEARENRASADVIAKKREIRDLETKVHQLERELDNAKNGDDSEREDNLLNQALSGFENALTENKKNATIKSGLASNGEKNPVGDLSLPGFEDALAGLDFSASWDAIP